MKASSAATFTTLATYISWLPRRSVCSTLHSMLSGDSAINGAPTTEAGTGVRPISSNLR